MHHGRGFLRQILILSVVVAAANILLWAGPISMASLGGMASALADTFDSGAAALSPLRDTDSFADFSSLAQKVAIGLLLILVVGVVAFSVLSSTPSTGNQNLVLLAAGPSADHLFLGLKYRVGNDDHLAYLRSIGLRHASFVSSRAWPRGMSMALLLDSLPGFSVPGIKLGARVVRNYMMGGEPPSFLVTLKFEPMDSEVRTALLTYIQDLSKSSQRRVLSHA